METNRSRSLFCAFILAVMAVLIFSAGECLAQKRLALLIGNSAYKNGPLRNPVNDVGAMNRALTNAGFDVMVLKNADRSAMGRAIDEFGRKLKRYDVGLFYFSGHGLQVKGVNYLVPLRMSAQGESDVQYEAIDAGKVLAKMEDAGNGMNVVILDACRNNPYKRSFRSARNGLAQMDAPTGSFIAFATSPGRVAYDGKGKNSPYVTHMINNMKRKGMTIETFFKQVRRGVMKDTSRKQVPWESSSLVGDFYFAGKGSGSSVPAPAPQPAVQQQIPAPTPVPMPQPKPRPKKSKDEEVMDMLLN